MGVYYNALDSRVQQAMTAVVGELAERYAHHASFGGVAVHLSAAGYSLLPDETCSYDGVTLRQFLNDTNTLLPADEEPSLAALARFLHAAGEPPWLAWRGKRLTQLYRTMQGEVTRRRPSARLYLTTADLLGSRQLRQALRPAPPAQDSSHDIFRNWGCNSINLPRRGIVVPRPQRIVPRRRPWSVISTGIGTSTQDSPHSSLRKVAAGFIF
jgi:hypothetical protein